ncbi:MAG TPA: nucleoside 2-deoxyribosyltransferase [Thermoanaerobaculaceae bacterium]|nr:nucleoside 2-deoxyribosyltransferase [Thermoanaerobaculaceae bacterium]HRS16635.1 nucleoside 2-deoxyribosyltransferase [Thermoanaerobaculaceae bacterium]
MRVYLCAAMTNADRRLADIEALLAALEGAGHEVPTRHVAAADARMLDRDLTDQDLAARDLAWLAAADAVIAEVTTPSHGVGVEVAHAVHLGKPVLALHRRDAVVSRLLTGLPGVERQTYETPAEAAQHALRFLGGRPR